MLLMLRWRTDRACPSCKTRFSTKMSAVWVGVCFIVDRRMVLAWFSMLTQIYCCFVQVVALFVLKWWSGGPNQGLNLDLSNNILQNHVESQWKHGWNLYDC